MTEVIQTRRMLDTSRLKHGGILQTIGLLVSGWTGVIFGSLLMGITVIGIFPAMGWMVNGLWMVPVFGFTFAHIGLARARDTAIKGTGTVILPADHRLTKAVTGLAEHMGLPAPLVGISPDSEINAFAAGSSPKKAVVSFTQGLVDQMPPRELLAVAAHELAHIANSDMRRMQFATSFQNSLTWYLGWTDRGQSFARWVMGFIGEMMVLRLSRSREYWADATAAAVVGREPMIDALRRLGGDPVKPSAKRLAYARMMIRSNPSSWFSTHPPIPDRIAAVERGTYIDRLPYKQG